MSGRTPSCQFNLESPVVPSGPPPSSFATNWTVFVPPRHVCRLIHHCLSGSCLPSSFPPTLREHFILFVCSLTLGGWCTRPGKPFRSRGSVQERPPLSFDVSRRSAAARGRGGAEGWLGDARLSSLKWNYLASTSNSVNRYAGGKCWDEACSHAVSQKSLD